MCDLLLDVYYSAGVYVNVCETFHMCTNWFERFLHVASQTFLQKVEWFHVCTCVLKDSSEAKCSGNLTTTFAFFYSNLKIPFLGFESECYLFNSIVCHICFLSSVISNVCIIEWLCYSSLANVWEWCSSTSLTHNMIKLYPAFLHTAMDIKTA